MISHDIGMYGNEDGSIPATFEILNFIGWKPHASQVRADVCVNNRNMYGFEGCKFLTQLFGLMKTVVYIASGLTLLRDNQVN